MEDTTNGDINWIIPKKFLAFPGPIEINMCRYIIHKPEDYINIFKKNNIKLVIRLNQKQ